MKARTTWILYAFLAGTVALTALAVAGPLATLPRAALETEDGFLDVLSSAAAPTLFALLLGIIALSGEFRHGTITHTFLATPTRGRVVLAKLLTYAAIGLALGVLGVLVTLAVAVPWLAVTDVDVTLADRDVAVVVVGLLATGALWGALGVGVATLVRNQVAAVVGALVWLLVAEPLLIVLLPEVGRWTPGGATDALTHAPELEDPLPAWGAAAVLVAYVLALAAIGTRLVVPRDVT